MTAPSPAPDPPSLFLIDAIGPFFRGYRRRTINWSKIPFDQLLVEGPDAESQWAQITTDLDVLCEKASAMGFNAVSLDDVSHLADHPLYELATRVKIARLRTEFRKCFAIARKHGMRVFLTMDIFSSTPGVREHLRKTNSSVEVFLTELLAQFFTDFPEVDGVIVRMGEADGKDVRGDFRSELHLKEPAQVNGFLKQMLPVFERANRTLIFRTWTVGAHRVGDLMWHGATFERVLKDLEDRPSLVVSMKYGESDFFRYLPLSQNFFRTRVAKIVELQTRREYEGCGEYPSFVGWEYERYARELGHAQNLRRHHGLVPDRRLGAVSPPCLH